MRTAQVAGTQNFFHRDLTLFGERALLLFAPPPRIPSED